MTAFRIGAGWTHAEIEDGVIEDPTRGLLRHVARGIAYRAVRNRGTIGGSLAHADPAADWVSTLAALAWYRSSSRAEEARSGRIAADAFMRGAFATALANDEVLVAVEMPRLSAQARWGYHKICRKTGEFAKAIGVAVLDPVRSLARVLAGAVEATPDAVAGDRVHGCCDGRALRPHWPSAEEESGDGATCIFRPPSAPCAWSQ